MNTNFKNKSKFSKSYNIRECSHGGIFSVNKEEERLVQLDFSSNINPLGISNYVINNISKDIGSLSSLYPDTNCRDLKKAIIKYINNNEINEDCLAIGNGATELIHNFVTSSGLRQSTIVVPTFCEYELACHTNNVKINLVNLSDNFSLNINQVIEKSKKTDVLFLCNPNNPTGLLSTKDIKKLINHIDTSTFIFIDESFIEFVSDSKNESLISNIMKFDNLLILRSMTKSFGLAGLRLGYLLSTPKIIKKLKKVQISWNVNGLAQKAGILALQDIHHLRKANKLIKNERIMTFNTIHQKMQNFIPFKSDVNFYLIEIKKITSTKLRDLLLNKYNILVRNCDTFTSMENKNMIRVAIKKKHENSILLKALKEIDNNIL